jgi:very-short-patch-repair endonuclease
MSVIRARRLRRMMTDAETILWCRLRRRQVAGAYFRRQVPFRQYVLDFVCFEAKLVIEVDGGQHAVQTAHDRNRTAVLEQEGFTVLRFWNHDVLQNLEGVLQLIHLHLDRVTETM